MTPPDSGPLIERLIASAQGALADVADLSHAGKKRALIAGAQVQADCAKALATKELANAVRALVVTEEQPE